MYHYSKQVGEEEEQGGGNTPNIEQDFKTSIGMLLWYEWCDNWTLIQCFLLIYPV